METSTEHPKKKYRDLDRERGKKHVNVTLTAEEYGFLKLKSDQAGQSPTQYLKNAALHQMAEKRHLNAEETELLRSALIEIRRIGNNLNQLAHNANSGFSIDTNAVKHQLRFLEDTVRKHFNR